MTFLEYPGTWTAILLVVLLAAKCLIQIRIRLRRMEVQISAVHKMLVVWSRTWGQPAEDVRRALDKLSQDNAKQF